ncbi:MAG: 3-phosphoshikimate 1-carboxyvinyltransferase, partial [Terriglobales bacterium]
MADTVVAHARNLTGAVRPPGDKSISHRCALLGGIADGVSRFENYSTGADCLTSLACMQALGAGVERPSDSTGAVLVHGVGLHGLSAPKEDLDAGNSGSTLRMLSGLLAAQPFATRIGGDTSLSRRPMRRIIEPLTRMGARIAAAPGDRPPLAFTPAASPLRPIEYALPVASAQVKSALLFAGLYAQGITTITEPVPTRDHSELLLRAMGAQLDGLRLRGPVEKLQPLESFRIPGDPSSAAFFLCAAAALP